MIRAVHNPEFDAPNAAERIPTAIAAPASDGLMTADEERAAFRAMNFLRHRAALAMAAGRGDEATELEARAGAVRSIITEANMGLVVAVVRRYVRRDDRIPDAIADGNVALVRAVDGFDHARGTRFSSYAWRVIRLAVARLHFTERKRRDAHAAGGEAVELAPAPAIDDDAVEAREQWAAVAELLPTLPDREREVLAIRYGLDGDDAQSQAAASRRLGVSASRIGQIEQRAIVRLRRLLKGGMRA